MPQINGAEQIQSGTIADARIEDFQWLMSINFWGVVHGTQAFLPLLKRAGEGHVVNISSLFGLVGLAGHGIYNASKFAMEAVTASLRVELRKFGIWVAIIESSSFADNVGAALLSSKPTERARK